VKSYKAIPEHIGDGIYKALLVVVDPDGKERALVRYQTMAEAVADRDYLNLRAEEEFAC
jgi:hypothetical protein